MQIIKINELKKHPRNNEFFDDISGSKWEDFLESIKSRGVIEGVVVTQDLVIVSGHQRVRACEELGFDEVPCRVVHYPEKDDRGINKEDLILIDLISTNIMQRSNGNENAMKMCKCVLELERIYNIKRGNNGKNEEESLITQQGLAEQMNITSKQLRNIKKLSELIPEFQDMVETGEIKTTMAHSVLTKLSKEDQAKFIEEFGREHISNMNKKSIQEYVDKINNLENELHKEKNRKTKTIEKVVECINPKIEAELQVLKNTQRVLQMENESLQKELEESKILNSNHMQQITNLMAAQEEFKTKGAGEDDSIKAENPKDLCYNSMDIIKRELEKISSDEMIEVIKNDKDMMTAINSFSKIIAGIKNLTQSVSERDDLTIADKIAQGIDDLAIDDNFEAYVNGL